MAERPSDFSPALNRAIFIKIAVTVFLAAWFSLWFYHPLDLLPADLGRHLMNGKIILSSPAEAAKLLHTNYYSGATPDAPFVNHHWFSGVIFYLIFAPLGFKGLQLFAVLINLITFLLFFRLAAKRGGFTIAAILALFLIPLIAERLEIRPEIFTYLCSALFLTILTSVATGKSKPRALLLLLPIQLFWVNCHIYFFLGPLFVGAYWLSALLKKLPRPNLLKPLTLTIFGVLLVSLINPSGWYGLIYPALIFNHYDFRISENQSVYFFESSGIYFPNLLLYKITAVLLWFLYINYYLKRRVLPNLPELLLALFVTIFAFWAIRNLALFAYLALVALAGIICDSYPINPDLNRVKIIKTFGLTLAIVFIISIIISFGRISTIPTQLKLGLVPGSTDVFSFINNNQLVGPMFNDYDIGSAATFYLFPRIRPFVENRPEAYPPNFMQGTFLAAHNSAKRWVEIENQYHLNLILFSLEDNAPWTKTFIDERLTDPDWAVVYNDLFAIALLRRVPQNATLIKQFVIPASNVKLPWHEK